MSIQYLQTQRKKIKREYLTALFPPTQQTGTLVFSNTLNNTEITENTFVPFLFSSYIYVVSVHYSC